jgi:hypothetical protein
MNPSGMGYEGVRVADVIRASIPGEAAGQRLANRARRLHDAASEHHTRVETGEARASVYQKPTVILMTTGRATVYETGAATQLRRMLCLEHGVRRHAIRPKRGEAVACEAVIAARVEHPGARGHHMFALAVAVTEARFREVVGAELDAWIREFQRNVDRNARDSRCRTPLGLH